MLSVCYFDAADWLIAGEKCIRCLLKVVYACDKEVYILGTPRGSPSANKSNRGNSELIHSLKSVLYSMICTTMGLMNKEVRLLS